MLHLQPHMEIGWAVFGLSLFYHLVRWLTFHHIGMLVKVRFVRWLGLVYLEN